MTQRDGGDEKPDYFDPRVARFTTPANQGIPQKRKRRPRRKPAPTRYQFDDEVVLGDLPKPVAPSIIKLVDEPTWKVKPVPEKSKWRGPYPSIELQGPDPNTNNPEKAVAFWLRLHKEEIDKVAKKWRVDRRAIAGVIAWEALNNARQSFSVRGPGPGKPHVRDAWTNTPMWTEAAELSGRLPHQTYIDRRRITQDPAVAIQYIAASLDVIATMAENRGWPIREQPGILSYAYHARDIETWNRTLAQKQKGDTFQLPRQMMGGWVQDHLQYLEQALEGL